MTPSRQIIHRARFPGTTAWVALVLVAGLLLVDRYRDARLTSTELTESEARVREVIDGDTLLVIRDSGRQEKVRVLGIDCPDGRNRSKQARQERQWNLSVRQIRDLSARATRLGVRLLEGRTAALVIPGDGDSRDPYDRLLAYVEANGVDYGAELLREGLASCRREPHPRSRLYADLNAEARDRKLGIYAGEP